MAEIKIPFGLMFRKRMLDGRKTSTTRLMRYGEPGDTFHAFGAEFELWAVVLRTLGDVRDLEYQREGFTTPLEFWRVWQALHSRRIPWDGDKVWFHVFRRLPADVPAGRRPV